MTEVNVHNTMNFQYNCINPNSLDELEYVIENNEEIEMNKFKEIIGEGNFNTLSKALGYALDFPIEDDWHVTYHAGKFPDGKMFAFLQHSGIEYVYY